MFFDRLIGVGVVLEVVEVFEANGAEDSKVVFFDAGFGVADEADEFVAKVFLAVDVVVDLVSGGVVEKAVDGEITPKGVLLWCGEGDGSWAAAVGSFGVGAKGGDFEIVAVFDREDDTELFADGDGFFK